MSIRKLLLVIVCAALSFGGSFTCKGHSGGTHFTDEPSTNQ